MGDTCKLLLEAIEGRTARDFEREILSFKPRPLVRSDEEIQKIIDKNPTWTIMALSWRTSEYIIDQLKKQNI